VTESLSEALRALGYRVDEKAHGFEVRLPLLCSVLVRSQRGENLVLDPQFGLVSRSVATWATALIILVVGFFLRAAPPDQLYLAAVGMLFAVVWDVYRYILTEHAMATVRQAYLAVQSPRA
jgi:hypothetical protein